VLSISTDLQDVLTFAPEWEQLLRNWDQGSATVTDFLGRVGAKALYKKGLSLTEKKQEYITLLRNSYFQPLLNKMLNSNQNMRRFLAQRHVAPDEQKSQMLSLSVELAQKMENTLLKHFGTTEEDGFKVLLPAYIQRSVHNAVIDYIRHEANWERQTLHDLNLDPQQEDPRAIVADDLAYSPEHQAMSSEQVGQLNQLRHTLKTMLADDKQPKEPLTVVDCIFGLGLTQHSTPGEELTMREVCEKLDIQAETMARRIARCQVLLDKGLDLVRQKIYRDLPGIAESWQRGVNVNTASRRELTQQLGMTEGEIERLIKGRQFTCADDLIERSVVKKERLRELLDKGVVAAFVPVDINSATARDMIDILGMSKEIAQRVVAERPFKNVDELAARNLIAKGEIQTIVRRGAVARNKFSDSKRVDINRAPQEEIEQLGVASEIADLIVKTRPYLTWGEAEDFLGPEAPWAILRQKFFLGLTPG
jgi:DNA uptake protein ComE-like DNA-binding protein